MVQMRSDKIWILGATGRVGRVLAARLVRGGMHDVVLVGRSDARLRQVTEGLGGEAATLVLSGADAIAEAVRSDRPGAVVNLLGSYSDIAPAIARACMPDGAYIDLANDLTALRALLDMSNTAASAASTLITGAGFGVLGTEAIVARLCQGRPTPSAVRADALASFASEQGVIGEAFAKTSVEVLSTGGLRYSNGRLVPARLGSKLQRLVTPDGITVASAAVPSGELLAARNASGAPDVDFTSALAPTSPLVRPLLPLIGRLAKLPSVRSLMIRMMAASRTEESPRPRPHTWGHAVVTWPDGTRREGWLRADDAMDYTAAVLAAVVARITAGDRPHGAFTPADAFGFTIATEAGGAFIDE